MITIWSDLGDDGCVLYLVLPNVRYHLPSSIWKFIIYLTLWAPFLREFGPEKQLSNVSNLRIEDCLSRKEKG